jgi:hypothetical protein
MPLVLNLRNRAQAIEYSWNQIVVLNVGSAGSNKPGVYAFTLQDASRVLEEALGTGIRRSPPLSNRNGQK